MKIYIFFLISMTSVLTMAGEKSLQVQAAFESAYQHYTAERRKPENLYNIQLNIVEDEIRAAVIDALSDSPDSLAEAPMFKMILRTEDPYMKLALCSALMLQMEKGSYSLRQKQNAVVFLLHNDDFTEPQFVSFRTFLSIFYDSENFNEEAKSAIKKMLLHRQNGNGKGLLLLDAADLYSAPEVMDFLIQNASKCEIWGESYPWYSLLLLARINHPGMRDRLLEIAAKACSQPERRRQILEMPVELSLVRDPRIVARLSEWLKSTESYPFSAPFHNSLTDSSAIALNSMIEGFPAWDERPHNQIEEPRRKYLKWLAEHPDYKFTSPNYFSLNVKRILWRHPLTM